MNVLLDMVGCRLNQAEIEKLAAQFRSRGHEVVAQPQLADLAVINTCSVTREAEGDSRQKVRQIHSARADARIVLTGCWATVAPREAASLPGVAWVIPNERKDGLLDHIGMGSRPADPVGTDSPLREPLPGTRHRTRAFLKIQDGCDSHCAFCLARQARGSNRSRPLAAIVREAQAAQSAGVQEIVLTGLALASYGRGSEDQNGLRTLLVSLLSETDLPRIRLSSLEPWHVSPDLFDLWKNSRLCPHLHLPLQSGCARTLQRMGRPTTPTAFRELVMRARSAIPDVGLTSEIIVGFPGETEEDFEQSLGFIQSLGFARLHVFPFSPRPATSASRMDCQIPEADKRRRAARVRQVAEASSLEFRSQFIGREVQALWESSPHLGPGGWRWRGLTGNFLRVEAISQQPLVNRITRVRLVSFTTEGLFGQLLA
ncbi:MAG: tRNA (N(6)-L-threonylcarbamoyladenosine(37)-C(2))-methylthiotransferase MtaB [Anaerolineales bacterium]|jgi:threonylcarbamoyladenosine tRNA methylthiotransferase MtaB